MDGGEGAGGGFTAKLDKCGGGAVKSMVAVLTFIEGACVHEPRSKSK